MYLEAFPGNGEGAMSGAQAQSSKRLALGVSDNTRSLWSNAVRTANDDN
jgi:hypothetical protein